MGEGSVGNDYTRPRVTRGTARGKKSLSTPRSYWPYCQISLQEPRAIVARDKSTTWASSIARYYKVLLAARPRGTYVHTYSASLTVRWSVKRYFPFIA